MGGQVKLTREEALKRLKATQEAKERRIAILKHRMCEKSKAITGNEPQHILFL